MKTGFLLLLCLLSVACVSKPPSALDQAKRQNQSVLERELSALGPLTYSHTTVQAKRDAEACDARHDSHEARETYCRPFHIRAEINARKDEYDHAMKVERIEKSYALRNMDLDIQHAITSPTRGAGADDGDGGGWNYTGRPGGLGTQTPEIPEPVPAKIEPVNHEQLEIEQASLWNRFLRWVTP